MSATRLKAVDVVIVGAGLSGTILAKELADAGLTVVGLERGGPRDTQPDFAMPDIHDELKYAQRHALAQDLSRETLTFRNHAERDRAAHAAARLLPARGGRGGRGRALERHHLALPALGLRDAEPHHRALWQGRPRPPTAPARTGASPTPSSSPTTTGSSSVYGVCGKAGNLAGQIQPGGNPFEGPRSREYPNPPMKTTYAGSLFGEGARSRWATSRSPRPRRT